MNVFIIIANKGLTQFLSPKLPFVYFCFLIYLRIRLKKKNLIYGLYFVILQTNKLYCPR